MKRSSFREHSSPVYLTSSFIFESQEQAKDLFDDKISGNVYSRFSNPNMEELGNKLCEMEGAEEGIITATGMSSVFLALSSFLKSGDHLVSTKALFGSTYQIITSILPRWNIAHTFVDMNHEDEWEKAIQPNTKLLILETPSNPGLDIVDLEKASKLAKKHGLILVVDNCFLTPYLQRPIEWGADIVIHSATKFIDGQGRVLGGAILGRKELMDEVRFFARHTGPAISPFNAWVLSKSLETLSVRMDRHCDSALKLATILANKIGENKVRYPFLPSYKKYEIAKKQMAQGGGIVSFELDGGIQEAMKFCNSLQLLSLSSNLGDSRSIATHPATTTHSKLDPKERHDIGISDGLIRISVGLENLDDIVHDVIQAIDQCKN